MTPMLRMVDVRKTYSTGVVQVEALRGIDLTVDEGDYLAIMGPSGSGKSTLMHIIGCLDVPSSGSYELDGNDVGSMTEKQLAEVNGKLPADAAVELRLRKAYAYLRLGEQALHRVGQEVGGGVADQLQPVGVLVGDDGQARVGVQRVAQVHQPGGIALAHLAGECGLGQAGANRRSHIANGGGLRELTS